MLPLATGERGSIMTRLIIWGGSESPLSDRVEDLAVNRGLVLQWCLHWPSLGSLHSIVCTPREMVTGVLPKFRDREVLGAKFTMGGSWSPSAASVLLEDLTETREGDDTVGGTS